MKSNITNFVRHDSNTNRDDRGVRRSFQTFIPGAVRVPRRSSRPTWPLVRGAIQSALLMLLAIVALGPMSSAHAQEYTFTTLAGPTGGPGAIDSTGAGARFNHPEGVAVDATGNVYVADQ